MTVKYGIVEIPAKSEKTQAMIPKIVLRDEHNNIVAYTDYAQYIRRNGHRVKGNSTTTEHQACTYICIMLNYFLKKRKQLKIKKLADISFDNLQEFMEWYCNGHGTDNVPGLKAAEDCRNYITSFIAELIERGIMQNITINELYRFSEKENKYNKNTKTIVAKPKLTYYSNAPMHPSKFTDLPGDSIYRIIELASQYDPMLTLGICTEAFGGVRAGGIVNMRTIGAADGDGIIITQSKGKIERIEIDIRREILRTKNGKHTGLIKRPRKQQILPDFNDLYYKCLMRHSRLLATVKNHNPDALFLNSQGYAMSYETYRQRLSKLFDNHVVPFLMASNNPEYQIAAQTILERGISSHAFRHWFSTLLAVKYGDPIIIMHWRGDSSIQSALSYLTNKGVLESQLRKTVNTVQSELFREGGNTIGKK